MNILITGASGFLGSNLTKHFLRLQYHVFALIRSQSDLTRLKSVLQHNKLTLIFIDNELSNIIKAYDIHIVIHTATHYGRNNDNLSVMMQVNELLPLQIMEQSTLQRPIYFFNTDTVLPVYINAYSVSKHNLLHWGKFLAQQNLIKFINLKVEHFYGYGDDNSKFISNIITLLANKVAKIDLTEGEQQRDFIYIKDLLQAYQVIVEQIHSLKDNYIEFDVGSGEVISIRDVVLLLRDMLNNNVTQLNFGVIPYRAHEVMLSKTNISALLQMGWTPQYKITRGLQEYIQEYLT